ncbi:gliding motility lipoprotein GldD [Flavobacteriaceae bacterium]|jgi:gliding motility-associated lipoprotein GldD|nr:gliding motility lipoprotein GldD [Flavobacteriaceae bacterium]MDA9588671.1 gliding motility lipoprotein GldD [Flavobacteriaceae bacterium]MDC0872771.1 gliding motility lipoprotein GldD [Flavobacteriaceae bacterium]
MRKWILFLLVLTQCNEDLQPKPTAYLRLEYPKSEYQQTNNSPYFSFEYNRQALVNAENKSAPRLVYPQMKATLYLNYSSIKKNLDSLLNDAYQLPYKHISKAESIPEKLFINEEKRVYGTLFSVVGNAASQYQFFLTDSLNHFLVGSLYFYARPNYDSIYPAISYLQNDIIHLMETLEWE